MKVIICGILAADIIISIESFPINPNDWIHANESIINPGGASIVAVGCARLGLQSYLLGTDSKDWIGSQIREILVNEGVKIQSLALSEKTPIIFSLVDRQSSFSRIVDLKSLPSNWDQIQWEPELESTQVLYIEGYACVEMPIDTILALLNGSRQRGVAIIFDPQTAVSQIDLSLLKVILQNTHTLTLNTEEAKILAARIGITNTLEDLLKQGPTEIFIKRGAEGCSLVSVLGIENYPGISVSVVNSQGAGDAFTAALIAGMIYDISPNEKAILANVIASLKVSNFQTSLGLPRFNDIKEALVKNGYGHHPFLSISK